MWMIIIVVLISLVVILLITPIHILFNSEEEEFIKGRYGLIRIGVRRHDESIIAVTLYVPFAELSIYPSKTKDKKEKPQRVKAQPEKRTDVSKWNRLKTLIRIAWQVTGKFKVRSYYLDIDTGNVILNANLYPVFALASDGKYVDLNVNYAGNFSMAFDVQNNLLNIIMVIIRNYFKRS